MKISRSSMRSVIAPWTQCSRQQQFKLNTQRITAEQQLICKKCGSRYIKQIKCIKQFFTQRKQQLNDPLNSVRFNI